MGRLMAIDTAVDARSLTQTNVQRMNRRIEKKVTRSAAVSYTTFWSLQPEEQESGIELAGVKPGLTSVGTYIGRFMTMIRNIFFAMYFFQTGGSPWETAVNNLRDAFTGPIAKALSLVAIVVGGLMFAFGEGGHKRALAGIIFGVGMAVAAANFLSWLMPGS